MATINWGCHKTEDYYLQRYRWFDIRHYGQQWWHHSCKWLKRGSILSETHELWCDPFEDVVVIVLFDLSKLQKYKRELLGYFPDGMSEDLSGWKLTQTLWDKDFHDVEKKVTYIYCWINCQKNFLCLKILFFLSEDFVFVRLYKLVSKVTSTRPEIYELYHWK